MFDGGLEKKISVLAPHEGEPQDVLKRSREISYKGPNKSGAYCLKNEMNNMTSRGVTRKESARVGID
jgi:hypothetical protein